MTLVWAAQLMSSGLAAYLESDDIQITQEGLADRSVSWPASLGAPPCRLPSRLARASAHVVLAPQMQQM